MKAIKDCYWEVEIIQDIDVDDSAVIYWEVKSLNTEVGKDVKEQGFCLDGDFYSYGIFYTKLEAIENFKKFAKLNGITNYKIIYESNRLTRSRKE